jgi:spore germination cell wall hydrolase CwlJ-like protein
MRVSLRNGLSIFAGATAVAFVAVGPSSSGLVAEPGQPVQVSPVLMTPAYIADPAISADFTLLTDDNVTFSDTKPAPKAAVSLTNLDPELECMAKVVRHEAANQARQGQRAVAEIMMNRARSGRFPATLCGVANQPGQFFNTASYNPRRDNAQWRTAVEVSREVIAGEGQNVAEGAYFYHASYQAPTRFFRTRQQVMAMGDHIFYR